MGNLLVFISSLLLFMSCASSPKTASKVPYRADLIVKAIDEGNIAVVKRYIQQKEDLNVQSKEGIPLVNRAAYMRKYSIVDALIRAEAPSFQNDGVGGTPLSILLFQIERKVEPALDSLLAFLIQKGGWLGVVNVEEETVLMILAKHEKVALMDLALKMGADPSLQDRDGKRALDYAKESGNPKLVELLK